MTPLDAYYTQLPDGHRDALIATREWLRQQATYPLTEHFKWATPVFAHEARHVCYLYHKRKRDLSYVAFPAGARLEHPLLRSHGQKLIRYLILDPAADLPVEAIAECLAQQVAFNRRAGKSYG